MTLAAVVCCAMTMAVLTACEGDNEDNPASPESGTIVGNWCSNVSGKTFAKWNYGDTWQNTVFNEDGTGYTRVYFTYEGKALGCEKIDFKYKATADGKLTMEAADRETMEGKWQIAGGELQLIDGEQIDLKYEKTSSDMAAKFDTWSKTKYMIDVPQPAKFTVFVYGNAGGKMDQIIEYGFWDRIKPLLTDHNNVRVVCMYKYGKDEVDEEGNYNFSGRYAEPGDIVWFELNSETDLDKIKEGGMQAEGLGEQAKQLKICDPNTMKMFLEVSSLQCPARDYMLLIWGHGSGFNALQDIPGKYDIYESRQTRGVMTDEWVNDEWMDMYEMGAALKAAGIDRLKTLMFHNCYMGSIEAITEIKDYADYILASGHVLSSDGLLATEFVHGMIETGDPEKAGGFMFENSTPHWQNGYLDAEAEDFANGDYKMIRTDKFDAIVDAAKLLCDRILELYPTQKEAINKATSEVYRYEILGVSGDIVMYFENPFFDIADYAHLLAKETGDAKMKEISDLMDNAFKETIVHSRDVNNSVQHLDHYTLTVQLIDKDSYVFDYKNTYPILNAVCNFNESYPQCTFHKKTGWGNWLSTNEQLLRNNPQKGCGGQLK